MDYPKLVTSLIAGISLCGYSYNADAQDHCTAKLSNKIIEDGWHFHLIARGDIDYARNYFFIEPNVQKGMKTHQDILNCIGVPSVKFYRVKNRRQILHYISNNGTNCISTDVGGIDRCMKDGLATG